MMDEQVIAEQVIQSAQQKQPLIMKHFQHLLLQHDLSHAYLFSGENGTGKMAVALLIAMAMFCPNVNDGLPCGHCNECLRIATHQHPDVVIIQPTGQTIKIDQVRMLKAEFSKSAVEGNQKIFIIDDANLMTTEAANSLLKFIEEPTGHIISFLLTNNKLSMLPTILSRTQVVEFPSLPPALFNQELIAAGINRTQFNLIATMTNNIEVAKQLNESGWFSNIQNIVGNWFTRLVSGDYQSFTLIQSNLVPLINNHDEQLVVINMMIQVWRDVLDVKFKELDKKELNFPNQHKVIQQVARQLRINQLLAVMNLVLANHVYLEHHVNFQNIIEATTLRALKIIKA